MSVPALPLRKGMVPDLLKNIAVKPLKPPSRVTNVSSWHKILSALPEFLFAGVFNGTISAGLRKTGRLSKWNKHPVL